MASLLDRVQRHVDYVVQSGWTSYGDKLLTRKWSSLARQGFAELVMPDGRLNADALMNFRRRQILIHDVPSSSLAGSKLRNLLVGWRRGSRHCLVQCLDILETHGYAGLLRQYPCHPAGNPDVFRYRGYSYTFRWARHVYFLGLLQKILGNELGEAPVVADIGSSYGIFSSLVKQELPRSHQILVDLPEQLILAHYFLGCCFPQARIASPEMLAQTPSISRDVVEQHDFLLIPPPLFPRLAPHCADLVTNFASFGEMSRQYFEMYLRSAFFLSSRYLFTINRIAAVPAMYDNDTTILDYPIWDRQKKLHFGLCPIYSVDFLFTGCFIFFCSTGVPQPHFEYIGRT